MDPMALYDRLPAPLETAAVNLAGLHIQMTRYGRCYREKYREAMARSGWSYDRKCEYRDRQLRQMAIHCYQTVPYYRRLFDEAGIDCRRIRRLEDLKWLPILTRQQVRDHAGELLSTAYGTKRLLTRHTSGTSGSPLALRFTREADAAVWASVWRGYRALGLRRGTWCGYFGGRPVVPAARTCGPYYHVNYAGRQILFSVYHMGPDAMGSYVEALARFRPPWIQGYPSALTALAGFLRREGLSLGYTPRWVTLSSENVSEAQLRLLEEVLGVFPVQSYAQTEAVAVFRQGPDRRLLVEEDFSAVELLPAGPDGLCHVVGTGLVNRAMPLLRYDTGDLVTFRETDRGREICSLDGRAEDDLQLRDGTVLRRLSRTLHGQAHVLAAQIVQRSLDRMEVHLVVDRDYGSASEQALRRALDRVLAGRMDYRLVYVDSLRRTGHGKVQFIISEL